MNDSEAESDMLIECPAPRRPEYWLVERHVAGYGWVLEKEMHKTREDALKTANDFLDFNSRTKRIHLIHVPALEIK